MSGLSCTAAKPAPKKQPAAYARSKRQFASFAQTMATHSRPVSNSTTTVVAGNPDRKLSPTLRASAASHLRLKLSESSSTHNNVSGNQAAEQTAPRCCACEAKNAPNS